MTKMMPFRPAYPAPTSGAEPVADLGSLPGLQSAAIRILRDWCDGPDGQLRVWTTLAAAMPVPQARSARSHLEALIGILVTSGRRPLALHAPSCPCVGADEAVFAHFLATAATGEREDAMLLASLLAPEAILPALLFEAQQAGLAIARLEIEPRSNSVRKLH